MQQPLSPVPLFSPRPPLPQPSPQQSSCAWLVVGAIVGGLATLGVTWLSARAPRIDYAPAVAKIPIPVPTPYPLPSEPLNPANAARVAQLARWGKGGVSEIAFSPNGQLLAVTPSRGVHLYAVADLSEVHFLPMDTPVHSVAFSPNGRTLASGSDDGTVRLWGVR